MLHRFEVLLLLLQNTHELLVALYLLLSLSSELWTHFSRAGMFGHEVMATPCLCDSILLSLRRDTIDIIES